MYYWTIDLCRGGGGVDCSHAGAVFDALEVGALLGADDVWRDRIMLRRRKLEATPVFS